MEEKGELTLELLHKWVETLLGSLDAEADESSRARIMESYGRACALHYGDIEKARVIRHSAKDVDELVERLNQQILWCGSWVRDGDTITSVCERCGCPLVREGLVKLSPTFCICSRGWVKAVFETALERPVEVDLEQAIGRGDPVCRFLVHPGRKE
jgi:predicted hydrocarbon binding protein